MFLKRVKYLFYSVILCFCLVCCKHHPDPTPQDVCTTNTKVSIDSLVHINCGVATGIIIVSVQNDTFFPFTYSLNGLDFQVSDTFKNLSSGNYSVTAMNSKGCKGISNPITIKNITTISAIYDVVEASCGSATGSIQINANGGIPPYQYSIDEGNTYQDSSIFSGLNVGNFPIRIKDSTNCMYIDEVLLNDNGNVNFSFSTQNSDCGLNNGEIQINILEGKAPFLFSIDNGATFQNDSLFTNLASGNYSVTVKDSFNCSKMTAITVNENVSSLNFTTTISPENCGSNDGSITVNATGGAGSYQYSLNGGTYSSSNIFLNLVFGSYSISVKDANNCIKTIGGNLVTTISSISYTNDVAPVLLSTCSSVSCHGTPTALKPNLSTWMAVNSVAQKIKTQLEAGTMPKTGTISATDKQNIICWINAGALNN